MLIGASRAIFFLTIIFVLNSAILTDHFRPNGALEHEMTIEVRDKRFGVIAGERGFITREQLFEAIKIYARISSWPPSLTDCNL